VLPDAKKVPAVSPTTRDPDPGVNAVAFPFTVPARLPDSQPAVALTPDMATTATATKQQKTLFIRFLPNNLPIEQQNTSDPRTSAGVQRLSDPDRPSNQHQLEIPKKFEENY
jgi:hypothetical protein